MAIYAMVRSGDTHNTHAQYSLGFLGMELLLLEIQATIYPASRHYGGATPPVCDVRYKTVSKYTIYRKTA